MHGHPTMLTSVIIWPLLGCVHTLRQLRLQSHLGGVPQTEEDVLHRGIQLLGKARCWGLSLCLQSHMNPI